MIDSSAPFPGAAWAVAPASWSASDGVVTVTAAAGTDIFTDPLSGAAKHDAALALATPPDGDWQFSARVRVDFRASWDAGALIVWSDDEHWAKLNFEQAPDGTPSVFSVVTRGRSDDAVAGPVASPALWLRISRVDDGFAFHTSADGATWRLVRQFTLNAPSAPRVGIEVQSPVGDGCRVTFDTLTLAPTRLSGLNDGA
ncbi:DUF1349 domain-containing protein [Streptomyces sp. NPDC053755]|uniref:DUF1349 domain-containing protein n=1 Tax=Streptomyces sp. NPDC053755 TaxID=3155815 RepID=UPI00342CCC36